jgi:hypothetical protein
MAFFCDEHNHAAARITASPKKPVKRPITRLLPE